MIEMSQNDTNFKISQMKRSKMILNDKIRLRDLSDQRLANRFYLRRSLTTLDLSTRSQNDTNSEQLSSRQVKMTSFKK